MILNPVRTSASGRGCKTKSHMKFDSNTLLRIAMKGICNVVNRYIQSGSIIDKDYLQELEQDNIIRWYRTEIAKATGHYPKSIPKELKDMYEELIPDLKDKTNKLIFTQQKKSKARQINEIMADAMLTSFLDTAGIQNYQIKKQRYRAKLIILMGSKRLVLPLRYSAFPEILDEIPPTLKLVEKINEKFGKDVKII